MKQSVQDFIGNNEKVLFEERSLGISWWTSFFLSLAICCLLFFTGNFFIRMLEEDLGYNNMVLLLRLLFVWLLVLLPFISLGFFAVGKITVVFTNKGVYKISGFSYKKSIFIPYSKITKIETYGTIKGGMLYIYTSGINILRVYTKADLKKIKKIIENKIG